jgi:hypothetical protein
MNGVEGTEGKAVMGNWESAAHTERGRDGNPPPKAARTEVLRHCACQRSTGK